MHLFDSATVPMDRTKPWHQPKRISFWRCPKSVDIFRTAVVFDWAAGPANLFMGANLVAVSRYAAVTSQLRIPSLTPSHLSRSRTSTC